MTLPNITIKRQAELLTVNRTSITGLIGTNNRCKRIDEIYMLHPYFGYRRMTNFQGIRVSIWSTKS